MSNNINTSLENNTSLSYQDLIGRQGQGGLGDRISGAYQDVQDALEAIKTGANAGDPGLLMDLQMKMNALTQSLSSTTQIINSLKSACQQINQNI